MSLESKLRWPGWDGWILLALAVILIGTWLIRGRLGGGPHLLIILALDLVYLGVTWLSRR